MSDQVGYKRPPRHSRWQKGQSGNPGGRRKGSFNLATDVAAELREVIAIKENGALKRLTKQRGFVKAIVARAIAGDSRAAAVLLSLLARLPEAEPAPRRDRLEAPEDRAILEAFLRRRGAREEGEA